MLYFSAVIGRQGEMINRLQAESGARIQVAPGEYSMSARFSDIVSEQLRDVIVSTDITAIIA